MRDLALSLAGGVATGLVGAAVILWVFVRVWREETAQENTATEEMRARTLSYYTQHLNDEAAMRQGMTASGTSRIAEFAATTNSNASSQV